jgi:SAM-dependent methyltransferase
VGSDTFDANREVFDRGDVVASYVGAVGLMPDEELLYRRFVQPGCRLLDLGVGTGRTTPALSSAAATYIGVDYAAAMIEQARRLHPKADLRVGDASDLSEFDDASFDVVVFSYNGLDYLHPDGLRARCLNEVRRVLPAGGHFLLTRHNPRGIIDRLSGAWRPRRVATELFVAARRARRLVPAAAFWKGEGYVPEPARGGLVHHMSTPRMASAELSRHGFDVVCTLSGRSTDRRSVLTTPWFAYAAVAR